MTVQYTRKALHKVWTLSVSLTPWPLEKKNAPNYTHKIIIQTEELLGIAMVEIIEAKYVHTN